MPSGSSQRFSSSCDSSRSLSRMLRRAVQAHEAGDLAKADRLYAAALQHEPDNFDALHGLGKLSCDWRRFDAALALIQRALTIDPGRADGFSSLGLVFYYLRRLNDALTSFTELLRLAPDNAELLNQRGGALLELGRCCDEALAMDSRIDELKGVETRIKTETEQKSETEDARLKSLITIYENMKPRDAAKIFNGLEDSVLVEVAAKINPRTMAEILAQMQAVSPSV
ncbi:MAG: tetratricopeptide repeat protein [Xanthobacteraceae bacterium]